MVIVWRQIVGVRMPPARPHAATWRAITRRCLRRSSIPSVRNCTRHAGALERARLSGQTGLREALRLSCRDGGLPVPTAGLTCARTRRHQRLLIKDDSRSAPRRSDRHHRYSRNTTTRDCLPHHHRFSRPLRAGQACQDGIRESIVDRHARVRISFERLESRAASTRAISVAS